MEKKFLNREFTLKAMDDSGQIEGYGSIFGNVHADGHRVMPGAFAQSLLAFISKGRMPKMLWQHDQAQPIGIWEDVIEDDQGLRVKGRLLLQTPQGRTAYELLKADALDGLSIGYRLKDSKFNQDDRCLDLLEIDLHEISLVTFPANEEAGVTHIKSKPQTLRAFEAALRDIGFSKSEAERISKTGFCSDEGLRDEPHPTIESADLRDEVAALLRKNIEILRSNQL